MEIEDLYDTWSNNFGNTFREEKTESRTKINEDLEIPENACYLGIDLPSWINYEAKKPCIILVGIDPLRNKKVFEGKDENEDIIIGTPYALHIKNMREKRTKSYWKFVQLLSEKYSVYLTDIYKIFYYKSVYRGTRSLNDSSDKRRKKQIEMLAAEMRLIENRKIIITMGKDAYRLLTEQKIHSISTSKVGINGVSFEGAPVVPMVHLSGACRDRYKKAFLEANGKVGSEYGRLFFEIINELLIEMKWA